MISIEGVRPSTKTLISHLDRFEDFCTGKIQLTPAKFREINTELSIGTVMLLGKVRYQKDFGGKKVFWRAPDNREHDLGFMHDANILRDYPGFHATRTLSLDNDTVKESDVIQNPGGSGQISIVKMQDGSIGIGPNYRMALRNAALRMHLETQFNFLSFAGLWSKVANWGHA